MTMLKTPAQLSMQIFFHRLAFFEKIRFSHPEQKAAGEAAFCFLLR